MKRMRIGFGLLALVFGSVIISGCARTPKLDTSYQSLPAPLGSPGGNNQYQPMQPVQPAGTEWQELDTKMTGATEGGTFVPVEDRRWEGVVLYFAYDSTVVGASERPKLEALSQHMNAHPNYSLVVEGHCDERGSDEYNRALGESRALAVRDYLINLGVDGARVETLSYGEERMAVSNATTEAEHQKNRRAEFVIGIRR